MIDKTIVDQIVALARCPVCGAERSALTYRRGQETATAAFACESVFETSVGEIVAATVCPAPSRVAATLMNAQQGGAV